MIVEIPLGLIDSISTAETQDEILQVAINWLPRIVGAERGSITFLQNGELKVRGFLGDPIFDGSTVFDPAKSRVGKVFRTRRPHVVADQRHERCSAGRTLLEAGFMSSICVPLLSGDQCIGTINLSHRQLNFFGDRELRTLAAVARLMASQIRIYQQMEQLNLLANSDPLTGSMNRRAFMERMDALMHRFHAEGTPLSVILLDLDRFKSINDRFGHSGGDEMLRGVADVLAANTRGTDMSARLGGEEFAVVLDGATLMQAELFAERFRGLVADVRRNFDGNCITCTTSVGVAAAHAVDRNAEQLLKRADRALYAAKENGRNRVELAA